MKVPLFSLPGWAIWLLGAFGAVLPGAMPAAGIDTINVAAVEEMTPEGYKVAHPTPAQPVYCVELPTEKFTSGFDLSGEKNPPPDSIRRQISAVLLAQGYAGATKTSVPAIAFSYSWGFTQPRSYRKQLMNPDAILAILAGPALQDMGFHMAGTPLGDLYYSANRPRYYLVISAYDYQALHARQGAVLLWRAHLSTPRRGLHFKQVMPGFIAAAAPILGRPPTQVFSSFALAVK